MVIELGYGIVGLLGLIMGSFAGATVWRLRADQLVEDKKDGEQVDAAELKKLKPLTKRNFKSDRSRCLHCGHTLTWRDLVPLVSWLSTKGKCRHCQRPIGRFEPAIELAMAVSFVVFYHFWVTTVGLMAWPLLLLWLAAIVMLVILFVYDLKWFLLPDVVMFPLIGVAAAIAIANIVWPIAEPTSVLSLLGSILVLGGLYLFLWGVSKGQWVGFGDVKLGVALGLLLGDWQLAFLALFLANLLGVIVVLPGLIRKKLSRQSHVPFGPFLIAGFALALLFGYSVIGWYEQLSTMLITSTLML